MDAKFTVEANPRIRTLAELMKLDAKDMRTLARSVDIAFTKHERALFASEGASGGPRWPELSPEYKKQKRKLFPGKKIMVQRGKLRSSLTSRTDPGHSHYWTLSPPTITVGTKDIKAAYHGPPNPFKNPAMPVRDTLQHTRPQEQAYFDLIRAYFAQVKVPRAMRVLAAWARSSRRSGTA